jgi:hypothetical protein
VPPQLPRLLQSQPHTPQRHTQDEENHAAQQPRRSARVIAAAAARQAPPAEAANHSNRDNGNEGAPEQAQARISMDKSKGKKVEPVPTMNNDRKGSRPAPLRRQPVKAKRKAVEQPLEPPAASPNDKSKGSKPAQM